MTAVIHGEGSGKPHAVTLSGSIPELDGLRGIAILLVIPYQYVGAPSALRSDSGRVAFSACSLHFRALPSNE